MKNKDISLVIPIGQNYTKDLHLNFSMVKNISVWYYFPSNIIPAEIEAQIASLFRKSYFRYHYLTKMLSNDRYRIVVIIGSEVIGFGTVEKVNYFGILSNFLVASEYRGHGIGSLIELRRFSICNYEKLTIYSSCSSVSLASQLLKLKHGLIPINIKYGYRRDVYRPKQVSSAISFISPDFLAVYPDKEFLITVGLTQLR